MELHRGNVHGKLAYLKARKKPSVLTIGNFDGVHLGHQAILRQVQAIADAKSLSSQILIFEPQPREFFAQDFSDSAPPRLMCWREKFETLRQFNLDRLILMRFDSHFGSLSPKAFVDDILIGSLGVKHLIVGEDFKFGAQRAGDLDFLRSQGNDKGFIVEKADTFQLDASLVNKVGPAKRVDISVDTASEPDTAKLGERVSSTWVRAALQSGDLVLANYLIGRPYAISGTVVRGDQLGRKWGFPTANIRLSMDKPALRGVYVVSVSSPSGQPHWPGVANLGYRPTVDGYNCKLEVHLFDYTGDLYGERLRIKFYHKLRDEKKFETTRSLIQAIRRDHDDARTYWQQHLKFN